jgi:hypothetical protein
LTKDSFEIKVVEDETLEKPKLPKGKQPRRLQDRSKYQPHNGKKECARRLKQLRASTTEDRAHTPDASEV